MARIPRSTLAAVLASGACHCPDDRCIGQHHGVDEACDCTASLIATGDAAMLAEHPASVAS